MPRASRRAGAGAAEMRPRPGIRIRPAAKADAAAACDFVRRSITELLAREKSGEVGLLYVAPEARFRGASNSMLRELERQATRWGATTVTAVSSLTARDFYLKRGYVASGEPVKGFGLTLGYPVSKTLPKGFGRLNDQGA